MKEWWEKPHELGLHIAVVEEVVMACRRFGSLYGEQLYCRAGRV